MPGHPPSVGLPGTTPTGADTVVSVFRFLLTPRWLAVHAALIIALAVCLVAGYWQWGVYQDSTTRLDERARDPVPVDQLAEPGTPLGDAVDRPVTVQGRYLVDHQLIIPGRIHDGVLGWFVLVPLDVRDGFVVPVLRGFVEDPDDAGRPPADVSVTGHLVAPETPDHATVRSGQELAEDELAYITPDTLASATGIPADTFLRGYVLADAQQPTTSDVATVALDEVAPIRNVNPWQNLSYTAQWWIFALAAIAFWISAVRSGIRARRGEDEPAEPGHRAHSDPETVRNRAGRATSQAGQS